ncbi:MAG: sulfatase-like hydrolase/transferase [Eubacterium sp.]|nr:sulfatase-like hydrolase/transferase [Eubacterium sp.]
MTNIIKQGYKTEYGRIEKAARSPEGFFAVFLALTELVFSLFKFKFDIYYILNKCFFSALAGFFLGIIISLLPKKAGKIISIIFSIMFAIYALIQLIYSSVFKNYWSVSATGRLANQAFDFKETIIKGIGQEIIPFILIILLYAFVVFLCIFWVDYSLHKWEMYMVNVSIFICGIVYLVLLFNMQGDNKNSPVDLIKNYSSVNLSVQKLGLMETFIRDGKYMIFERNSEGENSSDTDFEMGEFDLDERADNINDYGEEQLIQDQDGNTSSDTNSSDTNSLDGEEGSGVNNNAENDAEAGDEDETPDSETTEEMKAYTPQKLDIDLSRMSEVTDNSSVIELTKYITSTQPTYTNDYTGMFEGYNLIFIVAEGFDGYVIDREITPELYRMSQEGFYFTNFYTPLWYGSTLGGEYANLTGNMPKSGGYLSMEKIGYQGNYMPFCLGNELKEEGYYVAAYHNNEYTYYNRNISRPYLGYENYYGIGNGLECEKGENGNKLWPQSDLFMEENTFDEYSGESPFHIYYLTVSGHLNYNFSGNAMSQKNRDKVMDLPYKESTKAYIACQLEFEYMVEALNMDLEAKGIADNTLIVICGDHVPYNDMDILNDLRGTTMDRFERYKNTLIIYSASMEKTARVDKPCYSLDILPTVLNLMGLEYDSRMMVGRDILSDEPGFVIMEDGSFITENYKYDASFRQISDNGRYQVSDTELDQKKSLVSNRFRLADAICELNYYSYIKKLEDLD